MILKSRLFIGRIDGETAAWMQENAAGLWEEMDKQSEEAAQFAVLAATWFWEGCTGVGESVSTHAWA